MINIYEILVKNHGFEELNLKIVPDISGGLKKTIIEDYEIAIIPTDGNWLGLGDVSFYIYSLRFSKVMECLFHNEEGYNYDSIGHSYLGRKLRKDKNGGLAMSQAAVEFVNDKVIFHNGGVNFELQELIKIIDDMTSIDKILLHMYESKLIDFMVYVEEFWVFLYLCFEVKKEPPEILKLLKDKGFSKNVLRFKLKKEIDKVVIEEFERCYAKSNR